MLHYASGKPDNDDFQVVENQLAERRLFSVHPDHFSPVRRWLEDLRNGIFTFQDQLIETPSLRDNLALDDEERREELKERGYDPKTWVPYEEALSTLSDRLGPSYPKRIILDSGAFTDWGKGYRSNVDDVIKRYREFLDLAGDLFQEIYLINLDVIPGKKAKRGEEQPDPTEEELSEAMAVSDTNFPRLKAEFDEPVLPVFHQGESAARFSEVLDMADGYICLSPNNKKPEKERVAWTRFWQAVSTSDARCHGLATTGSDMLQVSGLYSGDSISWRSHGGNGTIDVRWDGAVSAGDLEKGPKAPSHYKNVHVAIERNKYDGRRTLPDNARHISELPEHEQEHVKARVERYLPFPMVQLDRRAMRIVSLGELQYVAAERGSPCSLIA